MLVLATETFACALPAAERRSNWDVGLHPVFQNLGPEGWLRQRQARAGRIEQEDDFGLLLRYGRDCIGAISVEPVNQADPAAPPSHDTPTEAAIGRSDERRVGKGWVRTCRSRRSPYH